VKGTAGPTRWRLAALNGLHGAWTRNLEVARHIIYVSCNPEALARDLAAAAERGYVESV